MVEKTKKLTDREGGYGRGGRKGGPSWGNRKSQRRESTYSVKCKSVVTAEEGCMFVGWVGDKATEVGSSWILKEPLFTLTKSLHLTSLHLCFPLSRPLFPFRPPNLNQSWQILSPEIHSTSICWNTYYMPCIVLGAWDTWVKILLCPCAYILVGEVKG